MDDAAKLSSLLWCRVLEADTSEAFNRDVTILRLIRYSFEELMNEPREWRLESFTMKPINLFVGRNSSGKTRFLNSLAALNMVIARPPERLWKSGAWDCTLQHDEHIFDLCIRIDGHRFVSERLVDNGTLMLERFEDGRGEIYSSELQRMLKFQVPENTLVIGSRRDAIQHPFLESINSWSLSTRKYAFGSNFGKDRAFAFSPKALETISEQDISRFAPEDVVRVYVDGYTRYADEFDRIILSDLAKIGYSCRSIDATPPNAQVTGVHGDLAALAETTPLVLSLSEDDLPEPTFQHEMSMGMFRALALIINVNHAILTKQVASIYVDDIGEGLDFERSASLIDLLLDKCTKYNIQLVMTTNDRFVMNGVPLQCWQVLHRQGGSVLVLNDENSKTAFQEFKFLGLSNFDFFSDTFYLDGQ